MSTTTSDIDTGNPWGLNPYVARALVHLADGGSCSEDVQDLFAAAREFVASEDDGAAPLRREYRVLRTDRGVCEVREVFFHADGTVAGWSSAATSLWGADLNDLVAAAVEKYAALSRPVLVETELPGYAPDPPR